MEAIKPTVLCIMDGFGIPTNEKVSGITKDNTKNIQALWKKYPHAIIEASGEAVGLPSWQTGTSDIGHLTIGTGRINYQPLVRINKAIEDGSFFKNEALLLACKNAKQNNKKLHIFGIPSDGGVHAHIKHIYALLKLAKQQNVKDVYLHLFTDGRDTPPQSALNYLNELNEKIKEIGVGKIATISGRLYALDRDKNFDRNKLAYEAMVDGKGVAATSAKQAIENAYARGESDEFILPTVIYENKQPVAKIEKGDSVIFSNYRADRERQLTYVFVENNDLDFVKKLNLTFVTMTCYDNTYKNPIVAFPDIEIKNGLSEVVSKNGLRQVKIAETEKYAYVAFSFNAGKQDTYKNEERVLFPSAKLKTFDQKPEMEAEKITKCACEKILSQKYNLVVLNLANPDMVGHSGNKMATREAIAVVDKCVFKLAQATLKTNGSMLVVADHGNADIMEYEDGTPHKAHTMAKVPAILVSNQNHKLKESGTLQNIAPTILELMGIKKPKEMSGDSLLK